MYVLITGRNEVVAKVIFLHLSVILFTGGVCLSACWDTTPPLVADTPPEQTPSRSRHPPGADTPPPRSRHPPEQTPPQSRHPPPPLGADTPPGSRLRHTVNERPVRVLLECILVVNNKETESVKLCQFEI